MKLLNCQIRNVTDLGRILDKLDDAQIRKGEIDKRNRQAAKIFVYEKKEGERYPRIEVQFKYAEEFQASLGLLEELQKDGDLSVKEESCSGEEGTLSGHPLMQTVSHGDKEGTYGKDE